MTSPSPDLYSQINRRTNEKLEALAAAERASSTTPETEVASEDPEQRAAVRILGKQVVQHLESLKVPSMPFYTSRDDAFYHDGKLWPLYIEDVADTDADGHPVTTQRLISITDQGDIKVGVGSSSKLQPRVLQGRKHAASAKAHGAFDVETLPADESLALLGSEGFVENISELLAGDERLTKYIDDVHTEANRRELDDIVASLNLPSAIDAAGVSARDTPQKNGARAGTITLTLDERAKNEAASADEPMLRAAIEKELEHLRTTYYEGWNITLETTRDTDYSKLYHIAATPPAQVLATPEFPPAVSVAQARLVGELAAAGAAMGHRVAHDLEHLDEHHQQHHEYTIESMAELRPLIKKAADKAEKKPYTFRLRYRRDIKPLLKTQHARSEEQVFPYIQDAVAELASDFPGYCITCEHVRTGHMNITVSRTDTTPPAHH
jgi:hypothetical protein